jgi:hypothetical protein
LNRGPAAGTDLRRFSASSFIKWTTYIEHRGSFYSFIFSHSTFSFIICIVPAKLLHRRISTPSLFVEVTPIESTMSSFQYRGDVLTIDAKPYAFSFPLKHTALLIIDMQRDFLLEKGFGEIQGGNLEAVQASIAPTQQLLGACRSAGMAIVHTREGYVVVRNRSCKQDLPTHSQTLVPPSELC